MHPNKKTFLLLLVLAVVLPLHGYATQPVTYHVAAGSTDVQAVAAGSRARLCSFSATETTGSATASVKIYRGTSTAGTLLYSPVNLNASESTRIEPNCESGKDVTAGIFIDRTGSIELTFDVQRF